MIGSQGIPTARLAPGPHRIARPTFAGRQEAFGRAGLGTPARFRSEMPPVFHTVMPKARHGMTTAAPQRQSGNGSARRTG